MDSPFTRSHWGSSPRYPPNFRGIPVTPPQTTPSHKPKVVSIPVHFVQPENCYKPKPKPKPKPNPNPNPISRSDYAIRIQKTWRGFRVRKNVKKILEIQRELDEVERMIMQRETVEAIRRDERERLKVSERLMALLFRLDSVGGFDGAVREFRRTVTRRAVVLQEKVDSIDPRGDDDQDKNSAEEPLKSECDNQPLEDDSASRLCEIEENQNQRNLQLDISGKLNSEGHEYRPDSESCGASSNLFEEESKQTREDKREDEESGPVERDIVVVQEEKNNTTEESKRNREMLEKMVEENNKLMALMADLFERNEMQTRILSSLSQRVEQLENVFACEKLRRAKKQKKSRNAQCPDKKKAN